ncbi:hypothetical protein ABZW32_39935, partial [Streptomyces sp. NPDC004667]
YVRQDERIEGVERALAKARAGESAVPTGHATVAGAVSQLHEARRLDNDIAGVDAALRQAEDSLRMNPRVREGLMFRLVLRTGLDTLEICAVVLRVSARALTDLAKARENEPLFSPAVTRALRDLFGHMALAVHSFSRLITAQVTTNAEEQEERLTRELGMARESRDLLASLLLEQLRTAPAQWQLHGALLADVDRVLDELDVDKRSHRLMEELDRHARLRRGRGGRLPGVLRRRG